MTMHAEILNAFTTHHARRGQGEFTMLADYYRDLGDSADGPVNAETLDLVDASLAEVIAAAQEMREDLASRRKTVGAEAAGSARGQG